MSWTSQQQTFGSLIKFDFDKENNFLINILLLVYLIYNDSLRVLYSKTVCGGASSGYNDFEC